MAQNSFQQLDFDGLHLHVVITTQDLSLDATIMVSKNCPIMISEHIVIIFVTQ